MNDLTLRPIGRIITGYRTPEECPRNISADNPPSQIEVDEACRSALLGMEVGKFYDILYWLDRTGGPTGVFSKRSPHRPNPIGLSRVELLAIDGASLKVSGLDCIDGTVLLDIKGDDAPDFCLLNCSHPVEYEPALEGGEWIKRLHGVRSNASKMEKIALCRLGHLEAGDPIELGEQMGDLSKLYSHMDIFGGCCGTGDSHLREIAKILRSNTTVSRCKSR